MLPGLGQEKINIQERQGLIMLLRSDIRELRHRMDYDNCGITRIRGAYVSRGTVMAEINAPFLSLPDNELYKYLDIARGCLSKKIGDNMLSLEIDNIAVKEVLSQCINSELKDDDAVEDVYGRIMNVLPSDEKYLILILQDNYDIPKRGTDGANQDESEDVYAYMMCIIIPMVLEKAGLCYDGEKIAPKIRQRVLSKPMAAFIYPSWEERTVEHDRCMFYAAKPDRPPHELMGQMLDAKRVETATEIKKKFEDIISLKAESEQEAEEYIAAVNAVLEQAVSKSPDLIIGADELSGILSDTDIPHDDSTIIVEEYKKYIQPGTRAEWLLDGKALQRAEEIKRRKELNKLMLAAADAILHPNIDEDYAIALVDKLRKKAGR